MFLRSYTPYLQADSATVFGTLRMMTSWLFGVVGNLNKLDADGKFSWMYRDNLRDLDHFTWKGQDISVEWMRKIPGAAVSEVQKRFDALWAWVGKDWKPTAALDAINRGFDSLQPSERFKESPNDKTSFLDGPDIAALSTLLVDALAERNKLVVMTGDDGVLNEATYSQFHRLVHELVLVSNLWTLTDLRLGLTSPFRLSWRPPACAWVLSLEGRNSVCPRSGTPVSPNTGTCACMAH